MAQRLCFDERTRIEVMSEAGLSVAEMADRLGRCRPRCIASLAVAAGVMVIGLVALIAARVSTRLDRRFTNSLVTRFWLVRSLRVETALVAACDLCGPAH